MATLIQTIGTLHNAVNMVNEGISQEQIGELKLNQGTCWQVYYIMRPCFAVALIVTIAAVIMAKWAVLFGSVPVLLLSGFGWYWMQDLTLLQSLDVYIKKLVVIINRIGELVLEQKKNLEDQKLETAKLKKLNMEFEHQQKLFSESTDKFKNVENKMNQHIIEENERLKQRLEELSTIADKLKTSEAELEKEKKISSDLQEQADKMEKENTRLEQNLKEMKKESTALKEHTETLAVNTKTIDTEEDKIKIETDEFVEKVKDLEEVNQEINNKIKKGASNIEEWKNLGDNHKISMAKLDEADDNLKKAGDSLENAVENLSTVENKLDRVLKEEAKNTDDINNHLTTIIEMMKNAGKDK